MRAAGRLAGRRCGGAPGVCLAPLTALLSGPGWAARFLPDARVRPDDVTVMMVCDAVRSADLPEFQSGGHGKFHVTGWTRAEQRAAWEMAVPAAGGYAASVLVRRAAGGELRLTLTAGDQRVSGVLPAAAAGWQRQALAGSVRLPQGQVRITLELAPAAGAEAFAAEVLSVELVRPAVRERLHRAALATRAETTWLQQAGHGFMVHWTSQSQPWHGQRKPYARAVREFDVEALASQVQDGGAGFLVLTTSHAEMYVPAPIAALERILPGRTTERDLVAELAEALRRRGIRLLLYYHLGSGGDPAWLQASGFWETDTRRFFDNWAAVIGEIGSRYGESLAGWWFDDGAVTYYHRNAPWERLTQVARAGNPRRLVGYNPWELPSPTEFQDYHCGEGSADPSGNGRLAVGGDGHYPPGPHEGLQACATLVGDGDWGHFRPDSPVGGPRWTAPELAALLGRFAECRNVPIVNLEIGQGGTLSPASIAVFREAARLRAAGR